MKRGLVLFILLFWGTVVQAEQLYLAYNVWLPKGTGATCINYKTGRFLPTGTPVTEAKMFTEDTVSEFERDSLFEEKIEFVVEGRTYYMKFRKKWHPGKTINDYYDTLFSTETLEDRVANKTIRSAILRGELIDGMSKDQTLIAYGYPPEHKTPTLNSSVWIYWMSRFKSKKVCFNADGMTMPCAR